MTNIPSLKFIGDKDLSYPYHLGCHVKTHTLCRVPATREVPHGFIRVLTLRRCSPYDEAGNLSPQYWSLPRNHEIERDSFPAILTIS